MPSTLRFCANSVVPAPLGNVFSIAIVSPISTVASVSFWALVSIRNLVSTDVNRGSGCGWSRYAAAVSISVCRCSRLFVIALVWVKYSAIDPGLVAVAVLPSKAVTTDLLITSFASKVMPKPSYFMFVPSSLKFATDALRVVPMRFGM